MPSQGSGLHEALQCYRDGDEQSGFKLVKLMSPLVTGMARRFARDPGETDDYYQVGMIGVLKAARRFSEALNVRFTTYAISWIRGEMLAYRRNCQAPIKVSRSMREQCLSLGFHREQLMQRLQREPSVSELAGLMGMTSEDLVVVMDAAAPLAPLEDDFSVPDEGECLEDRLVERLNLYEGIMKLTPMEREIIMLRFFKEKSQAEIARNMDLSQRQVSRIERRILLRLREYIQP